MEVVLGIGDEARPKACSSEIEQVSGEKTVKDDTDVAQENGVRVSVNGVANLNDSGVIEECMMNGVSSLLKLNQITENILKDEEDEEDEYEDDDDEDEEEEEHGYHVGDFVWGKIKHHPWWPGQIYDPSDASDLALKIKQKGKLLVAYFGDGTFAWCGPSQLKPFADGFQECSNVSNSRSFLGAVEEAVEEMGRHIERLLICDCAEEKHKFDNPEAKNAGIKEGVFVRDVRREVISSLLVGKPGGILEDVKSFAETVSFSGLLELEILKRKVSAFYRSKRGFGLPEYHEPQSVPGLEDKNKDDDDDDVLKLRHGSAKRSSKEEDKETEEKAGLDLEESLQRSLEKCSSGFPDHRLLHRRKLKSIAEIIENESAAKVRFEIESEDGDVKLSKKKLKRCDEVKSELATVTTTPRSRKVREVSKIEDDSHNQVEGTSKGKTSSRKGKNSEETKKHEISDSEIDIDSTPLASLRRKVRDDALSVERTAGNGETATQTSSKRERKKSKYFSPDFLSDFSPKWRNKSKTKSESSKVSTQSQVGQEMTDASDRLLAMEEDKLDRPCEPSLANGVDHQELSVEISNAVDFLRLGATSMVMRDLIRVAALGTQYSQDSSSREMVREYMSIYRSFTYHEGANSKFLVSCNSSGKEKDELNETGEPETKGNERKDKKRKAKQQTEEIEQVDKEENETNKHETSKKERKSNKSKSKKQGEEEEETLKEASESRKKEQKPKESESKKQGDKEERETLEKRKRKKPESKKQGDGEEETRKGSSESTKEERKPKKSKSKEEASQNKTDEPVKKKEIERESKKKDTEKEFSGAELFITFGPGSSLPKKEELIEIYEKFGVLDQERTDIHYTNFSGRVAFMNIADGEKAFESSQEKCPFASASTVKFRLKYPNERTEEKKAEAEVAETKMEMEYVKKKLEEMRTLVDECEGGMTEEVKVKLEDEMGNLLEKVRKMSSS